MQARRDRPEIGDERRVARVRTRMTDRTVEGIREVLAGKMRWHSPLLFAGPAVIASIAYMDPGNFATNIQAGAKYGYALLWVVLLANVIAMLYQALSAKLGIVTGRNLAEMCREHFPQPVVWALWIVSEVAAMATDLAEFLGGAIGLSLLLHIPLVAGMGVTAVLTYGILMFEGRGFRPIEIIIGALVAAIALCYLVEMFIAPIDWAAAGAGQRGSAIARRRRVDDRGRHRRRDDHAACGLPAFRPHPEPGAGAQRRRETPVAAVLEHRGPHRARGRRPRQHGDGDHGGERIPRGPQRRRRNRDRLFDADAAARRRRGGVFLTALLASGLSSSAVGTMAGQMIMQGFVGFRIPIIVRRLVTMIPAFIVVWLGVNSTNALVISQVVSSFALPAPVIALLMFTRRKDIMGAFANSRLTNVAAIVGAAADPDA